MREAILLVEEALEGGYTARALGASVFTEADAIDQLREQLRDAVGCNFDNDTPAVIRLRFPSAPR